MTGGWTDWYWLCHLHQPLPHFQLLTCCRTAWKCQLVTLRSSHLLEALSWDSISQVLGVGIAKVCLGQPPGLAWSRGQQEKGTTVKAG